MAAERPELPVDEVLPQLVSTLSGQGAVVLVAPTGAGKTTRVPPALLDGGLAGRGRVVVLEPRRLAARAAARRMAQERGGPVGGEVGYHVRFDRRVSAATRLEVVTEGLFVRRLQADPFLEGVGAVVFDEFHERHMDGDLAFAMLQHIRHEVRRDLPLVVMSATLDVDRVSAALGGCPVVRCEGRQHPVDVRYLDCLGHPGTAHPAGRSTGGPGAGGRRAAAMQQLIERVALAVRMLLDSTPGDVLVFLPGVGEIRRAGEALSELAASRGVQLCELFGDLSPEAQDAVLTPGGPRKLVLATNVAETSVTIPGVTGVVDSGLARVLRFHPGLGLDRLELEPISRASADQRAGRAGRTAPGLCIRLWSEADHRGREAHQLPEVRRVDLAGPLLQLLAWGERDPLALPWLEPPPVQAAERALALLAQLGAQHDGVATALGRRLARLPVHPRLARMLVLAAEDPGGGLLRRASLAAALLSERDPFRGAGGNSPPRTERSASDVLDRVEQLERSGRGGRGAFVLRAAKQLERMARERIDAPRGGEPASAARKPADEPFLRLLLAAFPDRVARRRERGSPRGVMVGGRGVRLARESAVQDAELFVCVSLDAGAAGARSEALVRLASQVHPEWLPEHALVDEVELSFDESRQTVVARRVLRYDDLILEQTPASRPDAGAVAAALEAAAAERLAEALPLDTPAVAGLMARLDSLRLWMPELDLPRFDEDALRSLLPSLCAGRRSFEQLRAAPLLPALQGLLDHVQRRALDEHAPERLQVPSGSSHTLHYDPPGPPVLAVRIQELFGWTETPRVGGGRTPVLLHLLAPNHRPQQVTDDLASFWSNTYPLVRKELRARYPRHDWPEDPWTAQPSRRPRRRR